MSLTKKVSIVVTVLVVLTCLVIVMRPVPLRVEVATTQLRPFIQTVEDQGRTRARNPYLIAAPIGGRLLRTDLDEGDRVSKGDPIARIALQPQDRRTQSAELANMAGAQAQLQAEQSSLVDAEATLEQAIRELERREALNVNRLASREEVENYQKAVDSARTATDSRQAAVEVARANVASVEARLLRSDPSESQQPRNGLSTIEVISAPADGTILKVFEESERVVLPGASLFLISNQDALEVVVDLLTQDAIAVESGDSVWITGWGGGRTLTGYVRHVEPSAFTKFSALGVEEQRVNVVIDIVDSPENLGAEYRVEVAIVISQSDSELTVATSALFQRADGWNIFVVEQGRVKRRAIEIASRNKEFAHVLSGLDVGEIVVQYPSDLVEEGVEVVFEAMYTEN